MTNENNKIKDGKPLNNIMHGYIAPGNNSIVPDDVNADSLEHLVYDEFRLPWSIKLNSWGSVIAILDCKENVIYSPGGDSGSMYSPEPYSGTGLRTNQAEFILKAVNSHDKLKENIAILESMRPHWAKGFTSDSIAAQVQSAALNEIYRALSVDNQTDAIRIIRACINKDGA